MSLNWKEIDCVLSELELEGCQIQKALQSAFDVIALRVHGRGASKTVLVSLSPGACRIHETFRAVPKSDKPLRFAEFLNSRITNGWIEEAVQLGDNRIVRLRVRRGEQTGGRYAPEETLAPHGPGGRDFSVRDFRPNPAGEGCPSKEGRPSEEGRPDGGRDPSYNERVDAFYAEQGGGLSLESLREQVRRNWEGKIGRLSASLEKLKAKEGDFASAENLKQYGDIILAGLSRIAPGDRWLEAEDFYRGGRVRIQLEEGLDGPGQAERYYERYRKAKRGLEDVRQEIARGEAELLKLEEAMNALLAETNPLVLQKIMRGAGPAPALPGDRKRPGLSFRRNDWLIIVGRDAAENDALLRRHVKGNDLWLHARDYPGAYVFVKYRSGKTVPLDILLDAGNLAIFYSKGRNNGEGDLFYTPVKYLRRAKDGPKGLVIPTHEKNLRVKTDEGRLRELELCRIEKL
ncbi:MAG: NFACT RNA binding domain-containing protein [Treponema sp.]|jgi:predicted ribosome quality control (RQC) complex YloA/Tae2 family protein|nr:NFACT RNA binding domain-containing protein [Treponema sp.]